MSDKKQYVPSTPKYWHKSIGLGKDLGVEHKKTIIDAKAFIDMHEHLADRIKIDMSMSDGSGVTIVFDIK